MAYGRRACALLVLLTPTACIFNTGGNAASGGDIDGGDDQPDADPMQPDAALPDAGCNPTTDNVCLDLDTLMTCEGTQVCEDGCSVSGPRGPHCRGFHPGNGIDPGWLDDATLDLDITNATRIVFDTSTGVVFDCSAGQFIRDAGVGVKGGIRYQRTTPAPGGVTLGVFAFAGLRLRGGGEIIAIGADGFGLLVDGELRLEDKIRAGAGPERCSIEAACGVDLGARSCAGAGGSPGGPAGGNGSGMGGGGGGSEMNGTRETGGGGGGFGGNGGAGGGIGGGAGGPVHGSSNCVPLVGGSGGGGGGFGTTGEPGVGGGGGGAVQLVSRTKIRIDGGGGVEVGGGGGGPGAGGDGPGAGGGGSGGAVLLESPIIDVAGQLAANGGGGGAGDGAAIDLVFETGGENGDFGATPAPGGTGFHAGGSGGAGVVAAGAGKPIGLTADATAGGGGAVGRVCLRSVAGGVTGTGSVSPAPIISSDLID